MDCIIINETIWNSNTFSQVSDVNLSVHAFYGQHSQNTYMWSTSLSLPFLKYLYSEEFYETRIEWRATQKKIQIILQIMSPNSPAFAGKCQPLGYPKSLYCFSFANADDVLMIYINCV